MNLEGRKYLEISTVHGLVYTTKRFHLIERIFWTITFVMSAICALTVIIQVTIKLTSSPIVVYLSDNSIPISEVNFPAVTLCPQFSQDLNRYMFTGAKEEITLFRYLKHNWKRYFYTSTETSNLTADEGKYGLKYLNFLQEIDAGEINPNDLKLQTLKRLQVVDLIANHGTFHRINYSVPTHDFLDVMNEFSKEFSNSASYQPDHVKFTWIADTQPFISEILTPYGLCLTFNLAFVKDVLDINTTSDDFHYEFFNTKVQDEVDNPVMPKRLPRRISMSQAGLNIRLLISRADGVASSKNDYEGYVLMVHDSYEMPTSESEVIIVHIDHITDIWIKSQLNSIENSLVRYNPKDRNCYLDAEKHLRLFKKYTKANCLQECMTDFMANRCGCVEFFMIRNSSTRICAASEQDCFKPARDDFEGLKLRHCDCLDPCRSIKHDLVPVPNSFPDGGRIYGQALRLQVNCRFTENNINELIRKQQFNKIDFFSYVGGLLGLFAGFSVLSFFELIYWFGIRIFTRNIARNSSRIEPFEENVEEIRKTKDFLRKFFDESSIHGFKFITNGRWIDRILWIIFIALSMAGCVFMILLAHEKVPDSRIIAYDDNLKYYDNIPFPAFTIAIDTTGVYGLDRTVPVTMEEIQSRNLGRMLNQIFRICFLHNSDFYKIDNMGLFPVYYNFLKKTLDEDWFPQHESTVNKNAVPVFAQVRTARGVGYMFNAIDADEMFNMHEIDESFLYVKNISWTQAPSSHIKVYGNFTFDRLNKPSFTIKLTKFSPNFALCHPISFVIHPSDFLPTFYSLTDFSIIPYGHSEKLIVTPEIIRTDEDLRSLSPQVRECYFDGEKSLKFFKKYTKQNCMVECMSNITFASCDCYDLPQPFQNESLVCDIEGASSKCFAETKNRFYASEDFSPEKNCSCLPACNDVNYVTKRVKEQVTDANEVTITIEINTEDAVIYRRYQQFTFSDNVSYVGGLLGLFAGISMLSFVEVFYFFGIRVIVNACRMIMSRKSEIMGRTN